MFNCQMCGETSKPYEKPKKVVSKKREREYPERVVNHRKKKYEELPNGTLKKINQVDPGGFGWEIVQELSTCSRCSHAISSEVVERVSYADDLSSYEVK